MFNVWDIITTEMLCLIYWAATAILSLKKWEKTETEIE